MHLALTALLLAGRWAAIVLPADQRDEDLAQNLSDVLVASIAERTHAELVGREEFRTQLGLSDRGVLGCAADTACLGRVGVQLKVDKMVVGQVSRGVGDEYIIFLNLIDVANLKNQGGELERVHGVPALVAKVQELAATFTGGKPNLAAVQQPEVTPPPPQVPLGEPKDVGVKTRGPRYRTAAWICTIGGGVSILLGIGTGAVAHSKATDLSSSANAGNPPVFDTNLQKLQTDGKNLEDAAKFFWAVGAISAVTGGVLFYIGRPVTVATDGRSIAIAGTF